MSFANIVNTLVERGIRKRVAVVWPKDHSTLEAVGKALAENLVDVIFVGCREEVSAELDTNLYAEHIEFIDAPDSDTAAAMAVKMVREGKADILMKGLLNTDNLLRAVLNKEEGLLPKGSVLTHVTAAHIPSYGKILLFTDPAVIPYPTDEQRHAQVGHLLRIARGMGVEEPKIALIHCSEKVDTKHFPFTADYVALREMCQRGDFGKCVIDGPLDVKTACNLAAMEKKGIQSPIRGEADGLVFPDIEAANAFYKTITLFCDGDTAGLLVGTMAPVILPSRGDSPHSKFLSIAVASLL